MWLSNSNETGALQADCRSTLSAHSLTIRPMTNRAINFSAGPATLPLSALESVQKEFLDFQGSGRSIVEHSHRGKEYAAVHEETKNLIKELFAVPETHEVLFMQGGATAQFALLPMNFLGDGESGDYVNTGSWSKKAIGEAKIVGKANEVASSADKDFTYIPKESDYKRDPNAKYLHITSNNTIAGTQYHSFPNAGETPLVADMSSDIGWRPIDVSKFHLIYAGAQKNMGPAGVTLLIANKAWIEASAPNHVPKIFRYKTILEGDSLQNTAPTFAIYMVGKTMKWVKEQGGLAAMEKRNRQKGETLYGYLDQEADYYRCPVAKDSRSLMNVVFRLPSEELEKKFVAAADASQMYGTKGHRSVGGIRISMYNAMEPENIDKLVEFMKKFKAEN